LHVKFLHFPFLSFRIYYSSFVKLHFFKEESGVVVVVVVMTMMMVVA